MLHCPHCSAPFFDIKHTGESVLDTIPVDSLAADLAAAVTKATHTIDKLESKENDTFSDIDKALEIVGQAWKDLHKLRRERVAATATANLRAKLPYIHLLSMDILSRIFFFCGQEHIYTSHVAIVLGGVCKKWRNVVERVSHCWTCLPRINFLEPTGDPTFFQLQQHIKRSRQAPLTAFFDFMESLEDSSGPDVQMATEQGAVVVVQNKVPRSDVLNVLSPILSRIHTMTIMTTDHEAHQITTLGQVEFTALEDLFIHLSQGGKQMTTFATINTFLSAPNLKTLSLSRCMHTAEVTDDLSSFSFPWQQLVSFDCCYFSTDNLIPVLRAAPQLQSLSFTIRPDSEPPRRSLRDVHDIVRGWEGVTHKGITDFRLDGFSFIKHEGGGETLVDDLLSRLTMPSLTKLCIERTKDCNLRQLALFVERSYLQDTLTMVDLSGEGGGEVPLEMLGGLTQLICLQMDVSGQKTLLNVLSELTDKTSFLRLRMLLLRFNDESCELGSLKDALRKFINARARQNEKMIPNPNYYDYDYDVESLCTSSGPRGRVSKHQKCTSNTGTCDTLHLFQLLLPRLKAENLKTIFESLDYWPSSSACFPASSCMKKLSKVIDDQLKYMETLTGKKSMSSTELEALSSRYAGLQTQYDNLAMDRMDVDPHLANSPTTPNRNCHPFLFSVRDDLIERVGSIEQSLFENKKPIQWCKTLSLQWKAQQNAYLNRNGIVQIYKYVHTRKASDSGPESSLWECVGLGFGVRKNGIVKQPFNMDDYSSGCLPEWRSIRLPENSDFYRL